MIRHLSRYESENIYLPENFQTYKMPGFFDKLIYNVTTASARRSTSWRENIESELYSYFAIKESIDSFYDVPTLSEFISRNPLVYLISSVTTACGKLSGLIEGIMATVTGRKVM